MSRLSGVPKGEVLIVWRGSQDSRRRSRSLRRRRRHELEVSDWIISNCQAVTEQAAGIERGRRDSREERSRSSGASLRRQGIVPRPRCSVLPLLPGGLRAEDWSSSLSRVPESEDGETKHAPRTRHGPKSELVTS